MVRERGLEPPPLAGPDPKSGVSAISPLAHVNTTIDFHMYRAFGKLIRANPARIGLMAQNAIESSGMCTSPSIRTFFTGRRDVGSEKPQTAAFAGVGVVASFFNCNCAMKASIVKFTGSDF